VELEKKIKIIEHYKLCMLAPEVIKDLLSKGVDTSTIKIYCSQNKSFWSELSDDDILEFRDIHYTMYNTFLEISHAKSLKATRVQIRKDQIKSTQEKLAAKQSEKKTKVAAAPKEQTPDWSKTPEGRAIYGIMKRLKCTKEVAEAKLKSYE